MIKGYNVFSCHRTPTQVTATLANGTQVQATVDSLEVQLVPVDGASGTVKLVYTDPTEMSAAEAFYVVGTVVTATFTQGA